jgi:hypothetical protein
MAKYRLAIILIAFVAASAAFGEEPAGDVRTFRLEPVEMCGPMMMLEYDPSGQEVSFKNEPAYGGKSVTRGAFVQKRDDEGPRSTIGFAYDADAGMIYLDLNRNWDLTDDGNNAFKSTSTDSQKELGGISFSVVIVSAGQEGKKPPCRLSIYWGDMSKTLQVYSGWSGEGELAGRKWCFTLKDNLDGVIDDGDVFEVGDGTREGYSGFAPNSMPTTSDWVLEGRQYRFEFKPADGGSFDVVATPRADAVAELNLPGKDIQFLQLEGPRKLGLPFPKERVLVSPGDYTVGDVLLLHDEHSAKSMNEPAPRLIHADAAAPATLAVGGPLRNTATVTRVGGEATLAYKALGIGGESYQFQVEEAVPPTTLTVNAGDQPPRTYAFRFG